MKTRPRLYWYLVCAYSPRLSPARLLWMHAELQQEPTGAAERLLLRRMRDRFNKQTTLHAASISPSTKLGKNLVLPHGLNGVHIAGEAIIGDDCTILQMVTIGSKLWRADAPVIGNKVFIGAGATLIGRCVIGDGAKIGAGVTLVDATVAPGEVIIDKSAYSLTRKAFIYPQD